MRRLTSADYIRVPWKNGGGTSTILAGATRPGSSPGDWSGVIWQLGRTSIVTPAPFSDLTGFERLQTVVAGRGLFLDTSEGPIDLSLPLTVARYDGGTAIVSRLTAGPVEVVNLIARRDLAAIEMVVLHAGQSHASGPAEALHVAHAATGRCRLTRNGVDVTVEDNETLQWNGAADIAMVEGTLILATLLPRDGRGAH